MLERSRQQPDVILVGGGHAHVQVLRRFTMAPVPNTRLTVVVDRPIAIYSGMVPGFVAGQYRAEDLEIDIVPLARRAGARVVLSAATGIDADGKVIEFADRPPLAYDVASLNIGSTVGGLDLPGIRASALPTRPIGQFVAQVDELLAVASGRDAESAFRVVVVGAGAGGVELAFTLEKRLRTAGARPAVTLLQGGSRILTGYPASLARRTERNAAERGIEIRRNARVVASEKSRVVLNDGSTLPFDALVWVTGAIAHGVLAESGLPTDDRGFVRTRSTLQVEGHDELFAVGDCGSLIDHPRTPKAGVYAVRQGPVVAGNIRRFLAGEPLEHYRPQHDFLTLLNLGDGSALGAKRGLSFEGRWVMRWKDSIDRKFMRRFQVLTSDGRATEEFSTDSAMDADMDAPCGGCAAKLAQEPLGRALSRLPLPPETATESTASGNVVELGLSAPDDAAVWHTTIGARVGSSVDLFSAFTDDPYLVGRVAAVNALSDLWATAITPRVAQAIVALPEELDRSAAEEQLFQVLAGARRELDSAGVALAGGHTTTVPGPLLVGFAVEGELESGEPLRKGGLRPGDALVLTKALGTGVIFRADMKGTARGPWLESAIASMLRPNREAAACALQCRASAMTDVTGFGLAGHLLEMLAASGVAAEIDLDQLPALPGAVELVRRGIRSTFHEDNARAGHRIEISRDLDGDPRLPLLFDPQTSGGLLFGVARSAAADLVSELHQLGDVNSAVIGRVTPPRSDDHLIAVTRAQDRLS